MVPGATATGAHYPSTVFGGRSYEKRRFAIHPDRDFPGRGILFEFIFLRRFGEGKERPPGSRQGDLCHPGNQYGQYRTSPVCGQGPKTVKNFVGLATGEQEWVDHKTLQKQHTPLYDGTIFHRVIPGFMIQGGDPKGNGTGGPGYHFEDEFRSGLLFDRPGLLAMANAGPNTNGSQFFITVAPTPHLNNRHTIFGEVIGGMDIVHKIVNTPRDSRDKPKENVVLKKVRISYK